MSKLFLRIVTPDCDAFSGEVEYLSVNTPCGREGFMCGALPRIGAVSAGYAEITDGGEKTRFVCGDGIICVEKSGVTIITSECTPNENAESETSARGTLTPEVARAKIVSTIKNKNSAGDR